MIKLYLIKIWVKNEGGLGMIRKRIAGRKRLAYKEMIIKSDTCNQ